MQFRWKKIDYTSPADAQGGPGIQKQMTWYVGTPFINMTLAQYRVVQQNVGMHLGDSWWVNGLSRASGGNAFMLVVSDAELTLGQLVAAATPTAGTYTAAGSTSAAIITNISEAAVGANGDVNNWIWVTATGATLPQLRRIKANNASATATFTIAQPDFMRPASPTDQDVFDTTPTNADVVDIIRPYHVRVCTDTDTPIGVCLGTVNAGNYTIIQIAGMAAVLADGSGLNEGLVVNQPAWTCGATPGAIRGANGVASLYTGAASILPQYATTTAGLIIPCFVNFLMQ